MTSKKGTVLEQERPPFIDVLLSHLHDQNCSKHAKSLAGELVCIDQLTALVNGCTSGNALTPASLCSLRHVFVFPPRTVSRPAQLWEIRWSDVSAALLDHYWTAFPRSKVMQVSRA